MAQAPFVIQPALTAIALTYTNQDLIADRVLPRIPVISQAFKWSKFTLADGFTIPDTRVGRKSRPGEIDWTASEQNSATTDYALDDAVPFMDIQAAEISAKIYGIEPIDPMARSTYLLTNLVALDRENRAANGANGVFVAANYPAANKATLAGTTQWSDFVNSDPVQAILAALDACYVRPNKLVIGALAWTKLRTHPKVTAFVLPMGGQSAVGSSGGGGGSHITGEAFAAAFELDEVIVGKGFYNSAKPGQTPNMTRLWGKHAALIYLPPNINTTEAQVTFGFTAQWGEKIAGTMQNDPMIGMRGGTRVRVGESVQEVIAANDAAYFFQNAVA